MLTRGVSFELGISQVLDRRSKVVKELSSTLTALVKSANCDTMDVAPESEEYCKYVEVLSFAIEQLFVAVPQTVKVIAEAGRSGIRDIAFHVLDDPSRRSLVRLWSPV